MHKYLFAGMLCMGVGGHFVASAAVATAKKDVAPLESFQNDASGHIASMSKIKYNKFVAWYETALKQGKKHPDGVTKMYEKIKKPASPSKKAYAAALQKPKSVVAKAFDKSHHSKNSHKHRGAETCLKKYMLECKHFGKNGVVITKPGYYCLSENVTYKPHYDNVPAITIKADDVILDLSTHVLSQCPNTFAQFDNTSAIVVESGYNFVTIKNGRIHNFSNNGVIVKSDNLSPDDHHGIVIQKIVVNDCGKITTFTDLQPFNARSGIGVYGTTDCVIQDCETSGITSLVDTEAICTFFVDNLLIKNCLSHDNISDSNGGFLGGIEVNFFNNAVIEGSASYKNIGMQTVGIWPLVGANLVTNSCQTHENLGTSFSAGIAIYLVDGGLLTNSQANFNVAKSENLESRIFCTGIQSASQSTVEIQNCSANYNLATSDSGLLATGCAGFDMNTVGSCILKNCTAEGNSNYCIDENAGGSNIRGGLCGGFDCDRASNVLLEDCVAIANNPQPGGVASKVAGFYASIFPEGGYIENIVYKNCTSLNHSSDFPGTFVAGFLIGENPPTTIVINSNQIILEGCVAEGNVNTSNPGNGAGVSFENWTTSSSVQNCIFKGNGVGILVRGENTVSNLFKNNEISANSEYGIADFTQNLNSYAMNYAYNPDAIENYQGLPAFTPVRTWQIGFAPAPLDNNRTLDPLDNISVSN